jgi:hypothetical protein
MKYTVRHIPVAVDYAIRKRARATGMSVNETAIQALSIGAGVATAPRKRRDLTDVAGSWKSDRSFDSMLAAFDRVERHLWR